VVAIPWWIYVGFSLPFFFMGIVVGSVVAGLHRVERPLVAIAGAVGALSGQWLALLELARLFSSPWLTSFVGAFLGSCVLSVIAAWLARRQ
jgi:uncharacterized membrane protein YeaQ/YmgE (transglycosylase-associated protein family)